MDESGTKEAECSRKVERGRKVVGVIRLLVNTRYLQLECVRVFHETLHVPILTYDRETMLWKRRGDLGLGLYRWTTSEACLVLGG